MHSLYVLLVALAAPVTIEGAAFDPNFFAVPSTNLMPRAAKLTCLGADVVQEASQKTGLEPGTEGVEAGQTPSATDGANFINFCQGQTITNGKQVSGGSCNPIVMGKIPASSNMISVIITNPAPGAKVKARQSFNVSAQTAHLDAGKFTNPNVEYYAAPQDLNQNGDVIGHLHFSIQSLGNSFTPTTPPDANTFAFFKGIDDAGQNGLLSTEVTGGLDPGIYRVCTITSAANHQPVAMPIAKRGPQEDCTKFEVTADGTDNAQDPAKGENGKNSGDNPTGTKATPDPSLETDCPDN